jgi:hypothetical protein
MLRHGPSCRSFDSAADDTWPLALGLLENLRTQVTLHHPIHRPLDGLQL